MTTNDLIITCPHCGEKYVKLPAGIGKVLHCRNCEKEFSFSRPVGGRGKENAHVISEEYKGKASRSTGGYKKDSHQSKKQDKTNNYKKDSHHNKNEHQEKTEKDKTRGGRKKSSHHAEFDDQWQPGDVIQGQHGQYYEVKSLLGEGGFGAVYRVYHKEWGIDIAVKKPKLATLKTAGKIENFEREAKTWVNLELHPHIVECYCIDCIERVPHIFMEYIDGGNLEKWIEQRKLYTTNTDSLESTIVHILDIAIQIAWGLHFAHESKLVHQDVKPANIMLTGKGVAKVTDFGLARIQNSEGTYAANNIDMTIAYAALKQTKNTGMTIAYAAPEQIQGSLLTRATDIWSWALVVLEMLKGERTWLVGNAAPMVLEQYETEVTKQKRKFTEEQFKHFQRLLKTLDMCFQENPRERPETLSVVTDTLTDIYLDFTGVPYPRTLPEKNQGSGSKLNNQAVSLIGFDKQKEAEVLWKKALEIQPHHLESTYNYGLILWRTARWTDRELIEQLEEARKSYPSHWVYRYLLATIHLERGEIDLGLAMLKSVHNTIKAQDPEAEYPEVSTALKEAEKYLKINRELIKIDPTGLSILDETDETIAFTQDRKSIVTAKSLLDDHYQFKVWNVQNCACVKTFKGYHKQMSILALSEDMRYVLTGSREGTLKLWVVENGRCLLTFKYSTGVRVIGFSVDNQFLFIRDGQGVLHHRKLMAITHPYSARFRLSKVRPPEVALIREDTHNFYLKEARKSLADKDIKQAASLIRWARAQPEHKHGQEAIALWRQLYLYLPRKTLKGTWLLSTWSEHTKAISTCVICTKAPFAFTASLDGKIRQWELNNAQSSGSFQEESEPITQLALSGNDRCLLYLSAKTEQQGDILKLYSVDNRHYLTKQKANGKVTAITLDTNGQYAVLGYITGTLELWDVSIPQGIRLRAFTGDLQDPHTGKWLKDVDKHTCQINAVAFTPDNRYILSADHYGVLKLWEIASGRCLFSVNEHHCPIHTLAMSTNGHFALTGGEDGTVKVWALWKKAQYLKTLSEHKGAITTVVYSKDGHYALSGSRDRTIKLWDIERGFCIHTFKHRSIVQSVALSADGSYVLAGYQCGTLKLWFLDWELADKEPVAWDEAAESFLESFYHQHIPNQGTLPEDRDPTPREIDLALKPHDNTLSSWTEADFKDLLYTLGCSGYGWLKPKGIKERLNEKKEQHRKEIWRARWQATYDLLHIPIPATLIILTMGIFFSTLSTIQLMSITFLFLAIFMSVIHFVEEDFALFPINKGLFKRPFTWLFLAAFFIVIGY